MATTARAGDRATARCSFCGKANQDVAKLVAGPGVYICNECVGLCVEIIERVPLTQTPTLDWTESLDDDGLLQHLGNVAKAGARVEEHLQFLVDSLRARRVTWARIGEALGMTRQSAWERFSGEE